MSRVRVQPWLILAARESGRATEQSNEHAAIEKREKWMDYFQGVVAEYLRADRSCLINQEFWLRGNLDKSKQYEKPHWYVDVLAVHMRLKQVFLCEVTYAKKAPALITRLKAWREHWPVILQTLREDASLPSDWPVHPWLFAPQEVLVSLRPIAKALHP
jgi:hypothetical protein